MAKADRLTIASGLVDGIGLMRRAGQAVAAVILERFPDAAGVAVLAGPGNNGGDGYVIAEELRRAGVDVIAVARRGAASRTPTQPSRPPNARCRRVRSPTSRRVTGWLVVDALFGAGLARRARRRLRRGDRQARSGRRARRRRRPAERRVGPERHGAWRSATRRGDRHLLPQEAGASALSRPALCGETIVADIGIRDDVLASIGSSVRRERIRRTGGAFCRRRQPIPTNMRAAMSACFPAGRPRPGRRGLRRWPRRAPGQGRSPCCRRTMRLP